MEDQRDFGDRKMYQGHWTCAECGAEITELPFEPKGDAAILCRDCHRAKRGQRGQGRSNFGSPRPMHQGNWTCAGCGAEITELPFEPDGDRPIYCRDCHRAQKGDRPRRF